VQRIPKLNLNDVRDRARNFDSEPRYLIETLILEIKDLEEDYKCLLRSQARMRAAYEYDF
jgi:hypothetical protein